jgi:hypothetical protein
MAPKTQTMTALIVRRLLVLALGASLVVGLFSELYFRLQKNDLSRAPMTVELVIPDGTAALVAAGENVEALPEEMTFVVGDTLLVTNQDSRAHELGPLFIPAGQSASMKLEVSNPDPWVECSFQPQAYFGLIVKEPINWEDRVQALLYAVPTTTMLLFVYSLILAPLKPKATPAGSASQ